MSVRIATPDDADAIERIRTDTWRATYRGLLPDGVLDRLGYDGSARRRSMERMGKERFALVALHDAETVGFCYGGPSRLSMSAYPGEIYAIYVLPDHQGHGHGSALMRAAAAESAARGWRGVTVWVLRENAPSRLFYERLGARYLEGRDETREIEGAVITESGYAWDDISVLALPARGRGP